MFRFSGWLLDAITNIPIFGSIRRLRGRSDDLLESAERHAQVSERVEERTRREILDARLRLGEITADEHLEQRSRLS